MMRVLFVSNGHGEEAISARIAAALAQIVPVRSDHLALVGAFGHPSVMHDVGPRRAMPSGGLIAMGNVRNIARDIGAGLIGHTLAQLRFLRSVRGSYDAVVAVGDVFALLMALQARAKTVYLGTAKSVHVAPYGPLEERVLRRANVVLTRDPATAQRLRERGVPAQAPGNVIADLDSGEDGAAMDRTAAGFSPAIGLFPGSRPGSAYSDAVALCGVVGAIAAQLPAVGGLLSIAPG
ncbi:MAG: hypothetical protein M3R35_00210, partial [Candidatus Eremiobacteraeota bacterium]|nr:hypothetical protein [Candidatus Eremiobacteraeota bacterium]